MSKKESASIVKESKNKQRKNVLWFGIGSAILLLGIGSYFFFFRSVSSVNTETAPQIIEPVKGDLGVSIESDGSIINPNMVDLSFFIDGTIEKLFVEEGDRVEAGQLLAQLDTRDLELDLKSVQSALQIAYANYEAKVAMLTDTQLRELETSLKSQQDEVDSIKRDTDQELTQALDLGIVDLETTFPSLESALLIVDSLLLIDIHQSDLYQMLSATHDSIGEQNVKNAYVENRRELTTLVNDYKSRTKISDSDISMFLWKTKTLVQKTQELMDQMIALMRTAIATSSVPQS
jgi:multidrug efflux pump subunit AcrA (membrane-fusion protein)